jgi:hypothetical protein
MERGRLHAPAKVLCSFPHRHRGERQGSQRSAISAAEFMYKRGSYRDTWHPTLRALVVRKKGRVSRVQRNDAVAAHRHEKRRGGQGRGRNGAQEAADRRLEPYYWWWIMQPQTSPTSVSIGIQGSTVYYAGPNNSTTSANCCAIMSLSGGAPSASA